MQKLVPCQSVSIDLWHVYHQCCTTWLTLLFFFNLPACFLLVFSLSLEIECARSAHLWKSDQKWKLKRWIKQRIITMGSASLSFLLSIFFCHIFFRCWKQLMLKSMGRAGAWWETLKMSERPHTHTSRKNESRYTPDKLSSSNIFLTEKKHKKLQRISMKGRPRRI